MFFIQTTERYLECKQKLQCVTKGTGSRTKARVMAFKLLVMAEER